MSAFEFEQQVGGKALPAGESMPPPRAMPGWCVVVPVSGPDNGLRSGVVVEMGWAEVEGSDAYLHSVPFRAGARVLYLSSISLFGTSSEIGVDGYALVQTAQVVAWTPEPGASV